MGRVVIAASLGALGLLGCSGAAKPLPPGDPGRPDIVLVSVDSLRADHLSAYGYTRATSPNLDRLAEGGLRFEGARASSPWTLPSHMTMLTGRWPTDHDVIEDDLALAPDVPMVQEALAAAGYATAGFVSTIYVSGGYGFARGFSTYDDYDITLRDNLSHPVRAERLVDDAVAYAREQGGGRPVFLFVHIYDVHYPYMPPAPWDTTFDRAGTIDELHYRTYTFFRKNPISQRRFAHIIAQYDESIAYVDHALGRLVETWAGSNRPAYWIVTSDHGEELGERGSWGHAHTLYREALEVPLIVAGPGISGAVRREKAGAVDLAATIAAMAGLPWAHGPGVDLRGPVPPRAFLAETSRFDSARLSIEDGARRLDLDLADGRRTVFELDTDPKEQRPVTGTPDAPRLEKALWEALGDRWVVDAGATVRTLGHLWSAGVHRGQSLVGPARFGVYPPDAGVFVDASTSARGIVDSPVEGPLRYEGPRHAVKIVLDPETRAQLEALGYVQGEE